MSTKAEQCKYSCVRFNVSCMNGGFEAGELSLVGKPRLPKQVATRPPHCRGWLEVSVRTRSLNAPLSVSSLQDENTAGSSSYFTAISVICD